MQYSNHFTHADHDALLKVALNSIDHGIHHGYPAPIEKTSYSLTLQGNAAAFVTLRIFDSLRGCIGSLEAVRPLVEDVNENAYAAAFRDPRFPPLRESEMSQLRISISVLSSPEPIVCDSEEELLEKLRVGLDGLILEEGRNRGTFLPSVWESLPDPHDFLRQLKIKAGLNPDYWSPAIRIYRYQTTSVEYD